MKKSTKNGLRSKNHQLSAHESIGSELLAASSTASTSHAEQQGILNLFQSSFPKTFDDQLMGLIQTLRGHLFNRRFAEAFNNPELSDAYAVQWAASRSLAYTDMFNRLESVLGESISAGHGETRISVVCIGGSAAELVALSHTRCFSRADVVSLSLLDGSPSIASSLKELAEQCSMGRSNIITEINGDWDALKPGAIDRVKEIVERGSEQVLICLMFTLNELYDSSVKETTRMLMDLSKQLPQGSFLMVVDSPGTYSGVNLQNGDKKGAEENRRYPMQWLLDRTLTAPKGDDTDSQWRKLVSNDSCWFRVSDGLQYPLRLENTRYQLHLYQHS